MSSTDPKAPTNKEGRPLSGKATEPIAGHIVPTKTPMYEAMNASRYHRQSLIKAIEQREGRTLICYVSGRSANIDRDDIVGFVEMLHNIRSESDIDLLLHTRGGDVDAAEKMMTLVQATAGAGQLRVII